MRSNSSITRRINCRHVQKLSNARPHLNIVFVVSSVSAPRVHRSRHKFNVVPHKESRAHISLSFLPAGYRTLQRPAVTYDRATVSSPCGNIQNAKVKLYMRLANKELQPLQRDLRSETPRFRYVPLPPNHRASSLSRSHRDRSHAILLRDRS